MSSTLFANFVEEAKAAPILPMRRFAEEKVIIPEGDWAKLKFRVDRQPFCKFWFDAIDDPASEGRYDTFVGLGPVQSGKSMLCLVIPVLYHLMEVKENVIVGVPRMEIAKSKWHKDFRRIFDTNPHFGALLPTTGAGAKGGFAEMIQFKHGPFLKFMSGGGDDKTRAEFPARVIAITEVDGFSRSELSKEADPIYQLIGRTGHYGARRRIYMECTVTTEEGRIWREWNWSGGQIALKCPHCGNHIIPITKFRKGHRIKDCWRDSIVGWQSAKSEVEAQRLARWTCPRCQHIWTEDDRRLAHAEALMIHHGQSVKDAVVHGAPPETFTYSLRWSSVNNFFTDAGLVGRQEWKAENQSEDDSPELYISQYIHAVPIDIKAEEMDVLSDVEVREKFDKKRRKCELPKDTISLTFGLDLGLRAGHYVGFAAVPCDPSEISVYDTEIEPGVVAQLDHTPVTPYTLACIDYGVIEIHSDEFKAEEAIPSAIRDFRDALVAQYAGLVDQVWIDARFFGEYVYEVCRDEDEDFPILRPCFGYGPDQDRGGTYNSTKKTGSAGLIYVGHNYHIENFPNFGCDRVEIDSTSWKWRVQEGWRLPRDRHGSITLFAPEIVKRSGMNIGGHFTFARHQTAEFAKRIYVEGKGFRRIWVPLRKANHYFDASYLGVAAMDFVLDTSYREERDRASATIRDFSVAPVVRRFGVPGVPR